MKWITGAQRHQMTLFSRCLDDIVEKDNEVRLIDQFVNALPLGSYGFDDNAVEDGRPKYHPGLLLKIFIYGYMNRIRSSRELERACKINVEMMWLTQQLVPDHNTINNFRKDNSKGIKEVFKATVKMAQHFELIGGKLLAGDSTKLRAQNSKKNNYNEKKIARHEAYINEKISQYLDQLEQAQDDQEREEIKASIEQQESRRKDYKQLKEKLKQTAEKQISTSDPDSRQMIIRNNITEVAYNVQTTVDATHKLLIDYEVTNTNDGKAMGEMVERSVNIIGHTDFTVLYDKGYHTGSEFTRAEQAGVDVLVAIPALSSASQAPDPSYNKSEFKYDEDKDIYICPQGEELTPAEGTYTLKDASKPNYSYEFKKYRTSACKTCPVKHLCTRSKTGIRHIERSEHAGAIERNAARIEATGKLYKERQAIVEAQEKGPYSLFLRYGTIKRQWGFDHIMTKKNKERASSDVGLIMSSYNLRRLFNILNINELMEYLIKSILKMAKWLLESLYRLLVGYRVSMKKDQIIIKHRVWGNNEVYLSLGF